MDKDYIQRIKTVELPRIKSKLKEIEKIHGKNSEPYNIAYENYIYHKNYVKHGIPKNVNQSVEIPYDLLEGF